MFWNSKQKRLPAHYPHSTGCHHSFQGPPCRTAAWWQGTGGNGQSHAAGALRALESGQLQRSLGTGLEAKHGQGEGWKQATTSPTSWTAAYCPGCRRAVFEQVKALFPPAQKAVSRPESEAVEVTAEDLEKLFLRTPCGVSPGPSGLRVAPRVSLKAFLR